MNLERWFNPEEKVTPKRKEIIDLITDLAERANASKMDNNRAREERERARMIAEEKTRRLQEEERARGNNGNNSDGRRLVSDQADCNAAPQREINVNNGGEEEIQGENS